MLTDKTVIFLHLDNAVAIMIIIRLQQFCKVFIKITHPQGQHVIFANAFILCHL